MFKDTSVWCIILVIIVIIVAYHIKNDVVEGANNRIDPQNSVTCGECVVSPMDGEDPPCQCLSPNKGKKVDGEKLFVCEPPNKCKDSKGNDIDLLKDYRDGVTPAAPGTPATPGTPGSAAPGTPATPGTPGSAAADSTVSKILKFVDDTIDKMGYGRRYDIHSSVSSYTGQDKIMNIRKRRGFIYVDDKLDSNGCKNMNIKNAMKGCSKTPECMGFTVDKKSDRKSNSPKQNICFKKNIDIFATPTKVNDSEKALFVKRFEDEYPINNYGEKYAKNDYVTIGSGYKGFEGQEKYIGMDGANLDVEGCKKMSLNDAEKICDKDTNCSGFSSMMGADKKTTNSEVCFKKNIDINKKLGKDFGSNKTYLYIKKKDKATNCSSLITSGSRCKNRSTLKKCLKSCSNEDIDFSCGRNWARFNGPNGSKTTHSCNSGSVISPTANRCRKSCKNKDKSRLCKTKAERLMRSKKNCTSPGVDPTLKDVCPQSCKSPTRDPFVQKGRSPNLNNDYKKYPGRTVVFSRKWKKKVFGKNIKSRVGEVKLGVTRNLSPNQAKKACEISRSCAGFTITPRRSSNKKGSVQFFINHKGSGENGLRKRNLKTRLPGSYSITTKPWNFSDTYIKDAQHYNKYSGTLGFESMGSLACVNGLTHSDAKSYCTSAADCDGFFAYAGNSPADNVNRDGGIWFGTNNIINNIKLSREIGGSRSGDRKMAPGTKYYKRPPITKVNDWKQCRDKCKKTRGCRYYNWFPNKLCALNDGGGGLIPSKKIPVNVKTYIGGSGSKVRGEIKKSDFDLSTEGRVCFKKNIFKEICSSSTPCDLPKPKLITDEKISEKAAFYTKIGYPDSQRNSYKRRNYSGGKFDKVPTRGDNEANYYK